MKKIFAALFALTLAGSIAYALQQTTRTPLAPGETGENSLSQGEIFNAARIKPGFGTATCAVSSSACAATVNNASGVITFTATTAGASGATPSVGTITDNKVQAGDGILCTLDINGVTAGSVPTCSAHITAAGTFTLTISNASVTALTSSTLLATFEIITQGNPN